jgi:heat shock protein HslJ
MHTSRISLDWNGAYEGVTLCAYCPRTATRLVLNLNETYVLATWPLTRADPVAVARGRFTWFPAGNAIALDAAGGQRVFFVGEKRLLPATRDGSPDPALASGTLAQLPRSEPSTAAEVLSAYRWRADSAFDAKGRSIDVAPAGARMATMTLSEGRISIEGNCNQMNGRYRVEPDGRLAVGRLSSTMRACEPAAMQADAALAHLLSTPLRADVVRGNQAYLRLVTAANDTLLFNGELTPEARYGAATIVFLEIAPERVPCSRPLAPASTCLSVRERHYDAQGLAVGPPGEWHAMHEEIEGFVKRDGERNVVRVKRFTRSPAPADASAYLYVLDLVVESEVVRR